MSRNVINSIKTRAYADYYFQSAQNYNALNWLLISAQSVITIASGVLLATNLINEYAAAKYTLSALAVLVGGAAPFIGKINAGARSKTNEKAGNDYAILSCLFDRADDSDLATNEKLNARYMQFIQDYDEPPSDFIEQRFEHLRMLRGVS